MYINNLRSAPLVYRKMKHCLETGLAPVCYLCIPSCVTYGCVVNNTDSLNQERDLWESVKPWLGKGHSDVL